MPSAECRRNLMEIWSTCKCVRLPLNARKLTSACPSLRHHCKDVNIIDDTCFCLICRWVKWACVTLILSPPDSLESLMMNVLWILMRNWRGKLINDEGTKGLHVSSSDGKSSIQAFHSSCVIWLSHIIDSIGEWFRLGGATSFWNWV